MKGPREARSDGERALDRGAEAGSGAPRRDCQKGRAAKSLPSPNSETWQSQRLTSPGLEVTVREREGLSLRTAPHPAAARWVILAHAWGAQLRSPHPSAFLDQPQHHSRSPLHGELVLGTRGRGAGGCTAESQRQFFFRAAAAY